MGVKTGGTTASFFADGSDRIRSLTDGDDNKSEYDGSLCSCLLVAFFLAEAAVLAALVAGMIDGNGFLCFASCLKGTGERLGGESVLS